MTELKAGRKEAPRARQGRALARTGSGSTQKVAADSFLSLEAICPVVTQVVEDHFNLVLEELSIKGKGAYRTLEIVLDCPEECSDPLSLDTVAQVSQALSEALDRADDGDLPYLLEVSSRGLSSPLTELRHWKHSIDRLLEIHQTDGQTYFARLASVTDEGPVICRKKETKKGQPESYRPAQTLPWATISSAKVEIEFNR